MSNAYSKTRSKLEAHEAAYPQAGELLQRVTEGIPVYGKNGFGEGKDPPASDLPIQAADEDDPQPMCVTAWGGSDMLAEALWKARNTRLSKELQIFVAKLSFCTISDQDDSGCFLLPGSNGNMLVSRSWIFDIQVILYPHTDCMLSDGLLGNLLEEERLYLTTQPNYTVIDANINGIKHPSAGLPQ